MTFTEFHYYSNALGVQTSTYVLLPDAQTIAEQKGKPIPTLYLLHGLSDDHTMWLRNTRIEQYARKYYLAVVMPAVNRSFYTDMKHGANYFTFISEELPQVMETYFPLCKQREGRFAAGLSMGGYGALKLALRCPERYAAAASFSGALEMEYAYNRSPFEAKEYTDIFGDEQTMRAGDDGLLKLAERLAQTPERAPAMYIACGTEDFLFEANEDFVARFGKAFQIQYHTGPGGHAWDFWDQHVRQALAWLPLEKLENVW